MHRDAQADGQRHIPQVNEQMKITQDQQQEVREDEHVEAQPVIRRSTCVLRPLDHYDPSLDYIMVRDCEEPSYYKEAMLRDDKLKWEKTMQ